MKTDLRRILVAVEQLQHRPLPALRKAAELARATGASIELFHAICAPPVRLASEHLTPSALRAWMNEMRQECRRRLGKIARIKALEGIRVESTVAWDRPLGNAIVRAALRSRADLVIAAAHPHTFRDRLTARSVDCRLIRLCPVPLLLVKSGRRLAGAPVIVAVDPFHVRAQATHLDAQLLRTGRTYAHWLNSPVHLFHAFMPLVPVQTLPMATAAPLMLLPPEAEPTHRAEVRRTIDAMARTAGIPSTARHIQIGDVARELTAVSASTRAGLVVMGAVSRSAVGRILIGSTAERVLDKLTCDVLIAKPDGFHDGRIARALGAQSPSPVQSMPMVML